MSITVLRAAILRRAPCANARLFSTAPTRSSLGLARTARHGAAKQFAPALPVRLTTVRYVSEEAKAKVNLRKAAVKSSSSVEDRVKKIVSEQLGVKETEVRVTSYTHQSTSTQGKLTICSFILGH